MTSTAILKQTHTERNTNNSLQRTISLSCDSSVKWFLGNQFGVRPHFNLQIVTIVRFSMNKNMFQTAQLYFFEILYFPTVEKNLKRYIVHYMSLLKQANKLNEMELNGNQK